MTAVACAPKPVTLPTGNGVPYPDYAQPFDEATRRCRGVQSITAELGLSGRVGGTKLRGRAIAGAAAPDRIRIEALAPFGPPVFVLVAREDAATLLLPRDERVLRDAPPAQIVEALTGVPIDPVSLRTAMTGCGVEMPSPVGARAYGQQWLAVDAGNSRTLFLRQVDGAWRVQGARTATFTLTYDEWGTAGPSRLTIRADGPVAAEIRLRLSQVEVNPPLGPEAFEVQIPADTAPITLGELRDAGPLGDKR